MREVSGTKLITISFKFLEEFRSNWVGSHILWVTYFWLARESVLDHRGENTGSWIQQGTCRSWEILSGISLRAPRTQQTQPLLSALGPQPEGPLSWFPPLQRAPFWPFACHASTQGQVTSTNIPQPPSRLCSLHPGPRQPFCSIFITLPLPTRHKV